jgi:hypothetical protein
MEGRSPSNESAGAQCQAEPRRTHPEIDSVVDLACTNDAKVGAGESYPSYRCDARSTLLAQCLEATAKLAAVDRDAVRNLQRRLGETALNLVVAGEFKRGKSSVINALLGAAVLPVGVVPLTSVITAVGYGDRPGATVSFCDGATRNIDLEQIAEFVTETRNPLNVKSVEQVIVRYPSAWLRDRAKLVDAVFARKKEEMQRATWDNDVLFSAELRRLHFAQRLQETALQFRRETHARMAATVGSIERAISDGAALRKRGEEDTAARFQTLTRSLASVEVLQKQVTEALQ